MSASLEAFAALPLELVRAAALDEARALGCEHAEVRIERIHSQYLRIRDGIVESTADDIEVGVGLRVIRNGSLGFAASVELTSDTARMLAKRAVQSARRLERADTRRVQLCAEPSHGTVSWQSSFERDATEVALSEKIALLSDWSERLGRGSGVDHTNVSLLNVTEDKFYADLNDTVTTQRRVRVYPSFEAVSVLDDGASFESLRSIAPPAGRGYEYLLGEGWDFSSELAELPELLAEKVRAPSIDPGTYDLVIDPTNLWLVIHESVGHATELDRALGYEAAYAGTSFATFDQLDKLRYGSPLMDVTGDRTTPHGLATIGYDDEGVQAQSFDIVRAGLFVGYQLDRTIATEVGYQRSNGCAFACSPLMTPIQRMANVSLQPSSEETTTNALIAGVDRGVYVVGDKSWSIDMQRHNFQFTGQRFYRIENGRIVGQLKDVAYQSSTTQFWAALHALGGESTYLLCGAMNCGKGQPGQVAPVSHGCPSALFRGVRVLNIREESGR